jgi:hypothetical protein
MRHRLLPVAGLVCALLPGTLAQAQEKTAPRLPSRAEANAVCGVVVARGLAIQPMLVESGVLDANNDGVADDVTIAMRDGTMRGEDLAFRPRGAPKSAKPVDVDAKDFQPGDYLPFGARWLPYGGKVYTLYFEAEDLRYPTHLGFIDATNTEHLLCDFDHSERETFRALREADAGLCRAVEQGGVTYAPVAAAADAYADSAIGRWMTRLAGRITVDFANRGTPAPLAMLAFESGAGRGCTFDYFDLLADGKIIASGERHASLMKLQDVELSEQGSQVFTDGRCDGRTPRWFARDGRTYLDIAGGPDVRGMEPFHEVRLLQGAQVTTMCRGSFAVSWKIKSMGPEFK